MTIYQPGDQLATLSTEGECRVWIVGDDGLITRQALYAPPPTTPPPTGITNLDGSDTQ